MPVQDSLEEQVALFSLLGHSFLSGPAPLIPRIAVNIDGVLANPIQMLLDMCIEETTRQVEDYHHFDCPGRHVLPCNSCICYDADHQDNLRRNQISRAEFARLQQRALLMQDFYMLCPAFEDDETGFSKLQSHADSGRIYYSLYAARPHLRLSGSRASSIIQTQDWLVRHQFSGWLHLQADCAGIDDLAARIVADGNQYHIGDLPDLAMALRARGVEAFLLTRPWNKCCDFSARVQSLDQFLDIVAPCQLELLPGDEFLNAA